MHLTNYSLNPELQTVAGHVDCFEVQIVGQTAHAIRQIVACHVGTFVLSFGPSQHNIKHLAFCLLQSLESSPEMQLTSRPS